MGIAPIVIATLVNAAEVHKIHLPTPYKTPLLPLAPLVGMLLVKSLIHALPPLFVELTVASAYAM